MSLFNKSNSYVEANVTADNAQLIYALLKVKNESDIRKEDNFRMFQIQQVMAEMKKLEGEILSKVAGSYVLEAAIKEVLDEEGNVSQEAIPAVYYTCTTKTKLISDTPSDILDVTVLCGDVEDYYGEYKESRTFTEFKTLVQG